VVAPAVKQVIRGYYKAKGQKVFRPFVRKERSDLFYPPKTGTSTYKSKKFVYRHTGKGILKIRNGEGSRYQYFKLHIRAVKQELGPLSTKDHKQDSMGAVLFSKLRENHFDLEVWSKTFRHINTQQEQKIARDGLWRTRCLREDSFYTGKNLRPILLGRLLHSALVRRVQVKWRTWDRRTSRFGKLSTKIQRAWRNYIFRGLGTRRTIIGQLSGLHQSSED